MLITFLAIGNSAFGEETKVQGFQWPTPTGWRTESIPFPLEFAPDIQHRGTVEVRFSPGFKDPDEVGFWSYAFVWWLEDVVPLTKELLADELKRYYLGLSKAVAGDKYVIHAEDFKAALFEEVVTNPYSSGYRGTIDSFDPFKTGKPLRLTVRIRVGTCEAAKRHFVLVEASPQPMNAVVWTSLSQVADSFQWSATGSEKEK
ncbi:MAG: hypothetical protein ACR2HH_13580 [Chthoniobacterales bacterium]